METTNNLKESILFLILVGLLVGANLFWVDRKYDLDPKMEDKKVAPIESVILAGQIIEVELAITAEEQKQGLSGREKLAPNQGMLFVFENPGKHPFWMKEMKFSIDMIWLASDGRVVYIKKNVLPESYPEVYAPDQYAKYVLEVNAGFSEKYNLKVGDGVEFSY